MLYYIEEYRTEVDLSDMRRYTIWRYIVRYPEIYCLISGEIIYDIGKYILIRQTQKFILQHI